MRSKSLVLGLLLMLIVPLAGISAQDDDPIEITVRCYTWMCEGELGLVRPQIEAWDEAHPEAIVSIEVIDDWEYLLLQDAIAGTAPDIVYYRDPLPLIEADQVKDISGWYDMEALEADFLPAYWNNFMTYEGNLYAIFQDTETRGVYYREDWLEEAGLELPENGWTFADMREYAAALTTEDRAGVCLGTERNITMSMALNAGYEQDLLDYDHPAVEAMYQFYADLVNDGSTVAEQAGLTRDQCQQLFEAGETAMILLHSNGISNTFVNSDLTPEQIGFVSLPVLEEGMPYRAIGGGWMWFVLEKDYSDEKEALIEDLFKHVTSQESQVDYALAWGFLLPRTSFQEALLEAVETDEAQVEREIFKYWPSWLDVAANTEAINFRADPNQRTWWFGLDVGVEAVQAGLSPEEAIAFARDYFDANSE